MGNTNLIAIFTTGLFVGGLSCMAVQGGLLAATIAQRSPFAKATRDKEEELKSQLKTGTVLPILSFLIAKLAAYTLLGFLLGLLGSAFQLSLTAKTIMQFAVALFMIGTALNILEVHPIFRYFVIQPPRFLSRFIRKQSKSNAIFAPALLGAFTVFIPCGTTQAMMALSIASGNPLLGAVILFTFVLGTSPVFFLLGYFATKLGDVLHQKFMKVAAYAIILLALFNLNNALALTGSSFTLGNVGSSVWCLVSYCGSSGIQGGVVDEATIAIDNSGYSPNALTVKRGSNITLHLNNIGGQGCTQAFTIPSLGIQKIVPLGQSTTVTFTAPTKPGSIAFMCSMGMYPGRIEVI